jgi:glycosyltransferase involved in cell wall biosynthesis
MIGVFYLFLMRRSPFWVGRFFGYGGFATATRRYVRALLPYFPDMKIGSLEALPPDHEFTQLCGEPQESDFIVVNHLPVTDPEAPAYLSVWEYDHIPDSWAKILHQARLILTQSEYCKNVFGKALGEYGKISIIPYILGDDILHYSRDISTTHTVKRTELFYSRLFCIFGSAFEWVARKVPDRMIQAFLEEFEPYEVARLVLRTYPPDNAIIKQEWGDLYDKYENAIKNGRIRVVYDSIPNIIDFYQAIDAFILCTAGEGYGQPLTEAMACGLPTIAANHSGNLEFMNSSNSYLVDVHDWSMTNDPLLIEPGDYYWRLPRVESLRKALRDVYTIWEQGKNHRIQQEALKIAEFLTPKRVGQLIDKALSPHL